MVNKYPHFPSFSTETADTNNESSVLAKAEQVTAQIQDLLAASQDTTPEQLQLCDLLEEARYTESEEVVAKIEDMINALIDPTLTVAMEFEDDLQYLQERSGRFDFDSNPADIAVADRLNEATLKLPEHSEYRQVA